MTQHLVVTAIGTDRTGLVSQLARLVTDCHCNILDSRMAIFGHELTLIMLLAGDPSAISRVEHLLPSLGLELDLLTMMKRTPAHELPAVASHYVLSYQGPDKVGTLRAITALLAQHQVSIAALRSKTITKNGTQWMEASMTLQFLQEQSVPDVEQAVSTLLAELQLSGEFSAQN
ncbi:glycine cleavage system protein R [Alkalimonas mucilaginosa]|uniref:Glycine cleavage system transcriptional repressor n=1 Tax=Alkalimonas mucilaginosa TaxID=3057676 RepID=A0ABU7JJT3_9GAMM|nr:ACT domain-containing protein [Alkalimonas sp. MEB004]MEE2025208.1 ACT domain-containing protein [Alkalimonas sp. MEB004]